MGFFFHFGQFEIAPVTSEPLQGLYSYMHHHRFLSALLLLINPLSRSDLIIIDVVLHFFEEFGKTQHGLCFLSSNPEATSLILRTLMHVPPVPVSSSAAEDTRGGQQQQDVDEGNVVDEFNTNSSSTLHRVGVQLAHSLYIIQCLDVLNYQVQNILISCCPLMLVDSIVTLRKSWLNLSKG